MHTTPPVFFFFFASFFVGDIRSPFFSCSERVSLVSTSCLSCTSLGFFFFPSQRVETMHIMPEPRTAARNAANHGSSGGGLEYAQSNYYSQSILGGTAPLPSMLYCGPPERRPLRQAAHPTSPLPAARWLYRLSPKNKSHAARACCCVRNPPPRVHARTEASFRGRALLLAGFLGRVGGSRLPKLVTPGQLVNGARRRKRGLLENVP